MRVGEGFLRLCSKAVEQANYHFHFRGIPLSLVFTDEF
jgi:hypothetical protein